MLEEQSRPGSIRYRFAHAFFRQTLYEELIAPRRLRLHQQVARALERQYASRLEEHAAELAEHFAQSTDRDDLAKAVRYGELAAQRALAVYAYGEAVRHLEQALEVQEVLDPDDKAKRCDLLLALGEALLPAGEPTRAVDEVAPEALELAEALGDRRRASRSLPDRLRGARPQRRAEAATCRSAEVGRAGRPLRRARARSSAFTPTFVALGRRLRRQRWRRRRRSTEGRWQLARRLDDAPALRAGSDDFARRCATRRRRA